VADRLVMPHAPGSAERARTTERMVQSLLNTAGREFRRAMAASTRTPPAPDAPRPSARRYKGWLTVADVRRLEAHLADIEAIFLKRRTARAGVMTVLTAVVVPAGG
jgi:hypothetical protein